MMQLLNGTTPALLCVLLSLIINMALRLLPILFYNPSYGWLHPLVFSNIISFLITTLRRLPLYINGLSYHIALHGWNKEDLTMLVAYLLILDTIAIIAYYFGFFFGPVIGVPRITFMRPKWISLKAGLFVFFSFIIFFYLIRNFGNVTILFTRLAVGRTVAVAEGQWFQHWSILGSFGVYACLLWFAIDRKAYFKPIFWILTFISIGIVFLLSASRSGIFIFIIYMLLIWILREQRISRIISIIVVLLGIIIIGTFGELRRSAWVGEVNWFILLDVSLYNSLRKGIEEMWSRSGSESAEFAILALVPDRIDFLYGRSYLFLLTFLIPRFLWSSKPKGIDVLIGETFFSLKAGKPAGSIGEAYWNFHIPGVILIFFLFGIFHKWLAAFYRKYSRDPIAIVIYSVTLFSLIPAQQAITSWVHAMIILLIIMVSIGAISFKRSRYPI